MSTGNTGLDALADAIAQRVIERMKAAEAPHVLKVQEAAKLLNISVRSVYAMIKRGELPSVDLNGRLMIRRSDIDRAIEFGATRG